MEIAPGIHLISGLVGTRPLQLYLLRGAGRCVLLDTGCAPDPDRIIYPYLRNVGLAPEDLDMVINTHSDMDHCGGNYAVKHASPAVQITCGHADRPLIQDPEVMWKLRYNAYEADHGIAYSPETRRNIFEAMGSPQQVEKTWHGGETVDLGGGWKVEVHHTPGHSPGHLAIFDPRSRTLLSGDAVHGTMYPDKKGTPALCPTYLNVDAYLRTIHYLKSLPVNCLATCHWPVKRAAAVGAFLDESLAFVQRTEQAVISCLDAAPGGLTLQQVIGAVGPVLGSWPRTVDSELVYAIAGHLEQLQDQGPVTAIPDTRPILFRKSGKRSALGNVTLHRR